MSPAWRIYYGDGSTFSDEDGSVADAPTRNVQAIVARDPEVGRYIVSRFDFYWWDSDEWFGGEQFGLFDYLTRPGYKRVLFGRTVSNAEFREVHRLAETDPDFPTKSARYPHERHPS